MWSSRVAFLLEGKGATLYKPNLESKLHHTYCLRDYAGRIDQGPGILGTFLEFHLLHPGVLSYSLSELPWWFVL